MGTVILGANGKLGSILHRHSIRMGLGWQAQSRSAPTEFNWSGDFAAPAARAVLQEGRTLINMIGQTHGSEEGLQRTNVAFVRDLLKQSADAGVAHVILASSAAVYGDQPEARLTEVSALRPITAYGKSKAVMEDVAARLWSTDGPAITILRIGNVAGHDALFGAATRHQGEGSGMILHALPDGQSPERSYIGPLDFARCVARLAAEPAGLRTINVAHPQAVTFEETLTAYSLTTHPGLEWTTAPLPPTTPPRVVLETGRLEETCPFDAIDNPALDMALQVQADRTP